MCNDYRAKTKRTTTFTKSNSTESSSSCNQVQSDTLPTSQPQSVTSSQITTVQSVNVVNIDETQSTQQTSTTSHASNQTQNSLGEFIPQFSELQRKQLDEQLRNVIKFEIQIKLK